MELSLEPGDGSYLFNNKENHNAMYHVRLFNYDIQLERYTSWTKFGYKRGYYESNLWEVIIDFGWWRLFINK
jgi:hypothetical protein